VISKKHNSELIYIPSHLTHTPQLFQYGCPRRVHDPKYQWNIPNGTSQKQSNELMQELYGQNKTLTGTITDKILQLQGVSWFKRTAISVGTVTLEINHYKDDEGIEHVDIDQAITGGIPGTREIRTLSWTEKETLDSMFGAIIGKSRRTKIEDVEEEFLKKGWSTDTIEHGGIQSYVVSDTPKSGTTWIANQVRHCVFRLMMVDNSLETKVWGVEEINGERRYVRHVKFTGPGGENIEAPLIYDYSE
jgi:hypothetical protein